MPATRPRVDPEQQQRAARDLLLIESFRAGRADAFDEIVRSYDQHVARILAGLCASSTDVEDLVQDVFLRVYRNLHRFRGQSSFYTWLYRVTVNVFFDHSKKRKRADARLARLQSAADDASTIHRGGEDPYVACFEALARRELARAIDALPEAFRTVVAMRELDDLTYEEISGLTGVSIGTVRSRLSRARSRLKESLRPLLSAA